VGAGECLDAVVVGGLPWRKSETARAARLGPACGHLERWALVLGTDRATSRRPESQWPRGLGSTSSGRIAAAFQGGGRPLRRRAQRQYWETFFLAVLCQFRSRRRARFNYPSRVVHLTSSQRICRIRSAVSHAIAPASSCGTAPPDLSEPPLTAKRARALLDGTETVSLAAVTRLVKGSQHVAHGKVAPRHHVHGGA
jgi:hypothetical protein